MITETINPGIHKADLCIKEIIFGNTLVDRYIGWDQVEATLLKIKCADCTLMVFGKKDMMLFKKLSIGDCFSAVIKESPYQNVYHFRYFNDKVQ